MKSDENDLGDEDLKTIVNRFYFAEINLFL